MGYVSKCSFKQNQLKYEYVLILSRYFQQTVLQYSTIGLSESGLANFSFSQVVPNN